MQTSFLFGLVTVVCWMQLQHDGDKIVYIARTGELAVLALPTGTGATVPEGTNDGPELTAAQELDLALWDLVPSQSNQCAPNTAMQPVMTCCNYDLRMFCSTVQYDADVMVHDGLDDKVAVFFGKRYLQRNNWPHS